MIEILTVIAVFLVLRFTLKSIGWCLWVATGAEWVRPASVPVRRSR